MVDVYDNDEDDDDGGLHVDRDEDDNVGDNEDDNEEKEDDDIGLHVDGLEEHEHEADCEEIVDRNGNHSAARFRFTKLGRDGNGNTKK